MAKFKKGNIIKGTITGIEKYGAFVSCDEYYSGLVHISEITDGYVKDIHDYLKIGDVILAKIMDVDQNALHLKLSIKETCEKSKRKTHKQKITETSLGFTTLKHNLPKWVGEKMQIIKKEANALDK